MRHDSPADPHFPSRKSSELRTNQSGLIPIPMLLRIAHDEREQLRARLLDLIERNEQARRNGGRWLAR